MKVGDYVEIRGCAVGYHYNVTTNSMEFLIADGIGRISEIDYSNERVKVSTKEDLPWIDTDCIYPTTERRLRCSLEWIKMY